MSLCLLALGSNLGDRQHHFRAATELLRKTPSVDLLSVSASLENVPIGGPTGQGKFLNAAILIETQLSPWQLLELTQTIEREQGRKPTQKWDARPLDIDLLLYDDLIVQTSHLTLPHPWLPVRRFVLTPARQIAPQLRHPLLAWSVEEMFDHLAVSQRFVVDAGPYRNELAGICAELACDYLPDPLDREAAASIPVTEHPIEFWEQRWEAFVASNWCQQNPSIVSEYWLGRRSWEICGELDSAAGALHVDAFSAQQSALPDIAPPKLYIHYRSSDDFCRSDNPEGGRKEFPWLNLTASSVERFRDEVTSAYLSMSDG